MDSVRRAVIDIGTNSVKMLLADVAGREVNPVWEGSKQTRLGSGLYATRRLQPEAVARTAEAVAAFAARAREGKAQSIRVIATSAARDALNSELLVWAIERESGLNVEIISGDREAALAFQGVTTDPQFATHPLLLLDVGGGSTEFIVGEGRTAHFQASFALGTVRLTEELPHGDPPLPEELQACRGWVRAFLAREVDPRVQPAMQWKTTMNSVGRAMQLVGTGGTTTILARMEAALDQFDRQRMEGIRLSRDRVRWHTDHLWSLGLARRQEVIGLPKNRADVILAGVTIYEAILEHFDFRELRVSTRGLRFAAVMDEESLRV